MYWLNGIASQLSLDCTVNRSKNEKKEDLDIISVQPCPNASMFITVTRTAFYVWSIKPITVLSFIKRTEKHILEFGENMNSIWKPDTSAFVIQTTKNFLLLYTLISYDQPSFEFNFPSSPHAFVTGPGEGKGPRTLLARFKLTIKVDAGIACCTSDDDYLILATHSPWAIQYVSWNPQLHGSHTFLMSKLGIMNTTVVKMEFNKQMDRSVWISNEGGVYYVKNTISGNKARQSIEDTMIWSGVCFHRDTKNKPTCVSFNPAFSLVAIGTSSGTIYVYSVMTDEPTLSHQYQPMDYVLHRVNDGSDDSNEVECLEWTSDGYAVGVGYRKHGLAVWSVYGALLCNTTEMDDGFRSDSSPKLKDVYVHGIHSMFWGPGNYQLLILVNSTDMKGFFTLPFAKSALAGYLHSDNIRKGLLQTDDRILLYNNGGDYQDNNTAIDPAAVAWTHIQYPSLYITDHWPIQYSSISADGRYIAIAGRKGFTHYNAMSNRWKLFGNQQQEQSFLVQGGLVWYKNILIVGCEMIQQKAYEIRLYSRENNLDNAYILYTETVSHPLIYITLSGGFLLVYTAENVLSIYNIVAISTANKQGGQTRLELVRRMILTDIIPSARSIKTISLFDSIKGDQFSMIEDVIHANVLFLIDGRLMLLCPKINLDTMNRPATKESPVTMNNQYDSIVISDKVEYYWIGNESVHNMKTSIWTIHGARLKIYVNLLYNHDIELSSCMNDNTDSEIESTASMLQRSEGRPFSLKYPVEVESNTTELSKWKINNLSEIKSKTVSISLDFYPLSIMLEKGIIIGVEHNISYKESLGFILFKISPKMHLFLHHILQYLLQDRLDKDAVIFAKSFDRYVYFSHALEILLHTVLEAEAGHDIGDKAILPRLIKFLDQFPHALDVIVSCARKTEVALWDHLFSVVGEPQGLFELCLVENRLRTATSYLIILQTMQPTTVGEKETIRLLQKAIDMNDYELCKELVRFLSSIDNTGHTLDGALKMIKSWMKTV
ncbi:RIC1-domain-containing protein [Pilobolus umbonatus]|nr:RIC1-domain-containing protein [Pilobolus umbonatus]